MAKVIRLILLFILFLTSQSGIAATTEFTVHQYDVNHIAQSDEIYGYDTNINLRHCCHILLTANTQDWSFLAFVSDFLVPKRGLGNANYAQKTFGETFSAAGKFAGQSVDDVAGALRSGKLGTADVPIDYIIRDGRTLILNTRSSQALTRAGIPRSQWNAVNRTGQSGFEGRLSDQLRRNKLTSEGTSSVRPSN